MKKSVVLSSLVAASLFAVSGLAGAQGAASMENPYVISPDGELVRNGTGMCVRTGYWSIGAAPSMARRGEHRGGRQSAGEASSRTGRPARTADAARPARSAAAPARSA